MSSSTSKNAPLYGAPRPKNKPIPLSSTSIHALSTELALAKSAAAKSAKSAPAHARATKLPEKLSNRGVSSRAAKDLVEYQSCGSAGSVGEHELERSRKKLKAKAKLYKELQRGDGDAKEEERGLVDFTRKWAEEGGSDRMSSSSEEEEEEMVEFVDEFGRTRKGTKRDAEHEQRRKAGESLPDDTSIRPAEPKHVIYGNTIQSHAFLTPEFATVPKSEQLIAALPEEEDEETHYDASKEVRTKGVGFYQFSKDSKVRKEEMEELIKERERTEREREAKGERRKRKREEIEKRREEVRKRRREKIGESWLENAFGATASEEGGEEEEEEERRD
ncbi:hypothetical protein FN846DRAFT_33433 [Sphaerosporella brunnea]|uniref:Uncharacterized protein n=1 Tax=Sphaerosporella brunnea TaxID=1250544 RepID=A0A5J5EV32_9PEZI|nr:hypothetical protein FN846DRAFT_33433 [Sphaerosporella brunnea]